VIADGECIHLAQAGHEFFARVAQIDHLLDKQSREAQQVAIESHKLEDTGHDSSFKEHALLEGGAQEWSKLVGRGDEVRSGVALHTSAAESVEDAHP
jgi:hypothetical protein